MITRQPMPAPRTELIRNPHRPEAIPATGRQLVIALRTEMKLILHMRTASRTPRSHRHSQQEVEHSPNPTRQHKADKHPEAHAHRSPGSVAAHIPHHQKVHRGQDAPGKVEVNPQPDRRRRMMPLRRSDHPPVVLDGAERDGRADHRPGRDQPSFFINGNGLRIAHKAVTEVYGIFRNFYSSLSRKVDFLKNPPSDSGCSIPKDAFNGIWSCQF